MASDITARPHCVWISWERHRRSQELARALGLPLEEIDVRGSRPVRYVLSAIATVAALVKRRPRVVFVMNPSIMLAALVCALKPVMRYAVVVDRHSNFDFANTDTGAYNWVSNYSLRRADLTIVTNEYVKHLVESKGGQGVILPDKLPTLVNGRAVPLPGKLNVVFVCTYSPDEPLEQVIEAARLLDADIRVHVTGNDRNLRPELRRRAPGNVRFTGFLSAGDYESLLASADLILELTTRDHTLLCGAYEAVSLGKPLVLSRMDALVRYFRRGAVVTENTAEGIAYAIERAAIGLDQLQRDIAALKVELEAEWRQQFQALEGRLALLEP